MQNEPTLQQLLINLQRMGAANAQGNIVRRAITRAAYVENARQEMTDANDSKARGDG